jgi:hypothetical protein
MNKKAIVRTAGLEKPDVASSGVKYPNKNKIDSKIIAVTSIENSSITNNTKPNVIKLSINIISGFMCANLNNLIN